MMTAARPRNAQDAPTELLLSQMGAIKILLLRSIHLTRTGNEHIIRRITCTGISVRVGFQNHAGSVWPSHQLSTHFYY
jgi:hypothetical protein